MSDFDNFENLSESESESCASLTISTTRSTKRPLSNQRKSVKISRKDEAVDTVVGALKKAQDHKEDDAFDIHGSHVAHELCVINNALAQNWAKLKIQEVLYQANNCCTTDMYPSFKLNSDISTGTTFT